MIQLNHPIKTFNLTIFYAKDYWHKILAYNFLDPINHLISAQYIEFSEDQGENIQWTFFAKEDVNELKNAVHSRVFNFISQNKSPEKEPTFPLKSFFMGFPSNNVIIDLQKPVPDDFQTNIYTQIKCEVSKLIINDLSATVIDDEIVINFLLNLQAAAFKVFLNKDKNSIKDLQHTINDISSTFSPEMVKKIDQNITNLCNQKQTISFLENIYDIKYNNWKKICSASTTNLEPPITFIALSKLLFKQLNIRKKYLLLFNLKILLNLFTSNYKSI